MNKFFAGFLGMVMGAISLAAATNAPVVQSTNAGGAKSSKVRPAKVDPNDPVEKQYQKMVDDDDAAQAEVDKWLRDNAEFATQGTGVPDAEMKRRIKERFRPIQLTYEKFLKEHPDHARGHMAYGSFLSDMQDEDGAQEQWETALKLDPTDPAAYNNLANLYGHHSPVKKAFEYYAKAIELNPNEPVYYHNYGTTVFLFRKDAREYFGITEQDVFNKALELYSHALKLDPTNFPLASDVAQTYYNIRPLRIDEALKSWTNTLAIANDEIEREGVYVHFARLKLIDGRFSEARAHINVVTNQIYAELKNRLVHNIDKQEKEAMDKKAGITNSPGTNAERVAAPITNAPPTGSLTK